MPQQPSLFDATAQKNKDDAMIEQLDTEIAYLEYRMKQGEAWLAAHTADHPRFELNTRVYWDEIVKGHAEKVVQRENLVNHWRCCVMQLPQGVTWGNGHHGIVKVLWDSQPTSDDEMTYEQLGKLIEDVKMVKEALS